MKSWFGKIISLALIVAMLLQLMPMSVFAAEEQAVAEPGYEEVNDINSNEVAPREEFTAEDVLFEDTSLREENIKHFRMSDGSYIAVDYGHAVHYIDEAGVYQEIDNRLVAPAVEDEQLELAAIETGELETEAVAVPVSEPAEFSAAERGSRISFAAEAASELALITIGSGDTEVKMSPYAAATVERMELEALDTAVPAEEIIEAEQLEAASGAIEAEAIEPEVIESEVIEPEVIEPEVIEPEAIEPEVIEPEVVEPEVVETEVVEPEIAEPALQLSLTEALAQIDAVAPVQMSAAEASVRNDIGAAAEKVSLYDAINPEKSRSSVVYEDIFPNVDLEYILIGNDVKENIIVKSRMDSYVFPFLMELGGNMTMEAQSDGSVLILRDGEPVYSIAAPYMYDANGETSALVSYEPIEVKPGVYLFTTEADADWINADGRAFPVTIDPSLVNYWSYGSMTGTYVYEGAASTSYASQTALYFGATNSSGIKKYRSFIKVNTLPAIPDNSTIVSAELQFITNGYSHVGQSSLCITAHQLGSDAASFWNGGTENQTWTAASSIAVGSGLDHCFVFSDTNKYALDITRAYVDWYNNSSTNYGIMIKAYDESAFTTSKYARASSYKGGTTAPVLIINYRNTVGIESYYTYQTHSVGRAGTGYIGDYTGGLTLVKEDASAASTVMPVSISHVYNSAYYNKEFNAVTGSFSSMNLGVGWQLSAMETVYQGIVSPVWVDSDGTEHYFTWSESAGYYLDEDGLGLKMTQIDSDYYIYDRYGGIKYFKENKLYQVSDANGNKTNYLSTSGKITSITRTIKGSSTETIATFIYDSSNYLTKITDYAGNATSFSYTTTNGVKYLTGITHPDGTTVTYTYYNGRLSTALDNESSYLMSYTFGANGRIVGFAEKVNGVMGVKIYAKGTADGLQAYCYPGADRQVSATDYFNAATGSSVDEDNILTYMLFDYSGRTVNTYSTNYDGSITYGADSAKYQTNSGTSSKNNRLLTAGSVGTQPKNFVQNSGFESGTTGWSFSNYSRTAGTGHTGSYFAKSTANGYVSQTVSGLISGKSYVISAYVNTSAASGSSGTVSFGSGQSLNYKSDGWERIWTTVEASGSTYEFTITSTGFGSGVYIDDIQVEPCLTGTEGAPSNVNLLTNGTIDSDSNWTKSQYCIGISDGTIIMSGTPDIAISASQTVTVNQPGTETYMLSAWAKAESAPLDQVDRYSLKAVINYSNGTTETYAESFTRDYTGWQYLAIPVVPTQRSLTVSSITVSVNYNYNLNTAYFDDIALVREEAASYKYNDNGDLVSAASSDTDEQSYSYSGADLISQTTMGNGNYTYTYDSKHNVLTAKNDGVTMTMAYDSAGNTTSSVLTNATDSTKITSSATYTNNNNLLLKSTDSRGYSTNYTYTNAINKQLNIPDKVTDANNTARYTSINAQNGRTTSSYISGLISVSYGYSGGVLSTITRGGYIPNDSEKKNQTYTMAYNAFDQLTSVKVGTTTLATYTYATVDGLMTQMKYGNNHVVEYTYDKLERPDTVVYNDGTTFTYTYNGQGGLGKLSDSRGRDYVYNYDSLGRLVSMREFNGSTIIQSMSSDYDSSNRVSTLSYRVSPDYSGTFNDARTYAYTYNNADGTITKLTGPGGRLAYDYDNLNRLRYKNTYNSADGTTMTVSRQYGYLAGSGTNVSSNLVGSLILKNGTATYSSATYGYDALGNITSITDSYLGNRAYTYDAQGQMLTETRDGTTYTYTYDTYGNIRSVKQGSTTIGTYTYETSGWLDKLTAYNGDPITYDGAGNPTTWPGITSLSWSNGKQLTGATVGNKNLTFTYDVDGLRLTKYDGSYTHNYIWQGDRLVSEYYNSKELEFFYDESGTPYAFDYNGTIYYYITNLQGDVIAIVDSSGGIVGTYKYDAWGAIVDIDDTNDSGIVNINPLRYRGYYFDTETGLYYLQSRYYDPEVCRFINADEVDNLAANGDYASLNLFAYCGNNPVARQDDGGDFWNYVVGAAVGAIIGGVKTAVDEIKDNGWSALKSGKTWAKIGISSACGAVNGLFAASGALAITNGAVGGVTGMIESLGHELIDNDGRMTEESWNEVAKDTAIGFIGGFAGGRGGSFGNKYMANQEMRFLSHVSSDGFGAAHSYAWKMTSTYSKQFIAPTVWGLTKGTATGVAVDNLVS